MTESAATRRGRLVRERWAKKHRSYLSGQPVRLITKKSPKQFRGLIASMKMYGMVPYESGYERDAIRELEVNNTVAAYYVQPETIEYTLFDKRHRYTPDIAVEYADGRNEIIEVKPERFANHPENLLAFEAIRKVYEWRGISYRVVTEKDIYHNRKARKIKAILRWRDYSPPPEVAARVSEVFSTRPPATLGELEKLLNFSPDDRHKLIAMATRGYFTIPLDEDFTVETPVSPSPIDPFRPYSARRLVAAKKGRAA
jgi:hypothetical protein